MRYRDSVEVRDIEQRWLRAKWNNVRESQMAADEAAKEWSRMNEAFKDRCARSGITDAVDIAYRKGVNLELKDFMNIWDWHCREAQRHMQDILTFKAMKEMGAL